LRCKTNQAIMRLSAKSIKALQVLLEEHTGREYSNEEAQQAGLAIMRFVVAKHQRHIKPTTNGNEVNKGENSDDIEQKQTRGGSR